MTLPLVRGPVEVSELINQVNQLIVQLNATLASAGGGVTMPITGTPDITMSASAGLITVGVSGNATIEATNGNVLMIADSGNFQASVGAGINLSAAQTFLVNGASVAITAKSTGMFLGAEVGNFNAYAYNGNANVSAHGTGKSALLKGPTAAISGLQAVNLNTSSGSISLSAHSGQIVMPGLPTSDPHISNALWASGAGFNVVVSQG